ADRAVPHGEGQRMIQPIRGRGASEQLARHDTFVDEVNPEIIDAQPTAAILQLVRVGDDRGVTARFEVFAADFKLGPRFDVVPVDDRYGRAIVSAPFAVTIE